MAVLQASLARRRLKWGIVVIAALVLLLGWRVFLWNTPLSDVERRLVGEWAAVEARQAGFALDADRSYQVVIRLPGTLITPAGQRGRWFARDGQLSMKLTVVGAGTSTWEKLTARVIGVFDEGLRYPVEFVDDDTIRLGDEEYRRVKDSDTVSGNLNESPDPKTSLPQ